MAGNRVEELEAKVRELEATIDGLTDELVETKERLQAIEEETGVRSDALERRSTPARERRPEPEESTEEPTDDAATESADDVNSEQTEGEDNADSESGDDIIVA
jgi:uncharacterized coiled-coil protein SlyX